MGHKILELCKRKHVKLHDRHLFYEDWLKDPKDLFIQMYSAKHFSLPELATMVNTDGLSLNVDLNRLSPNTNRF